MVYADTSALVALFAREPRGVPLQRWFDEHPSADYRISEWGATEVASALAIKVRRTELNQHHLDQAWKAFQQTCGSLFRVEVVTAADFADAATLCRSPVTGLRASDALHLAIAMRLQCDAMMSFDHTLNRSARACGLAVVAPD